MKGSHVKNRQDQTCLPLEHDRSMQIPLYTVMVSAPPPLPIIMGGNYNAKILWGQNFSYISGGTNLYGGEIFITTISLFHFFRNNKHPEK